MTKRQDVKEAKRIAVAARFKEIAANADILLGMYDERTLDVLILVLGIGRVELDT